MRISLFCAKRLGAMFRCYEREFLPAASTNFLPISNFSWMIADKIGSKCRKQVERATVELRK